MGLPARGPAVIAVIKLIVRRTYFFIRVYFFYDESPQFLSRFLPFLVNGKRKAPVIRKPAARNPIITEKIGRIIGELLYPFMGRIAVEV